MSKLTSKLLMKLMKIVLSTSKRLEPKAALKLLLNYDNMLDKQISHCAIKYDRGLHPKHRLTLYHNYFVKNIDGNENILDIGCGRGAVTFDVAQKTKGKIIGIDKDRDKIDYAGKRYRLPNLEFIHWDVLLGLPEDKQGIDTVIMSNFIEHIEKREELIIKVLSIIKPRKMLFRVPMYEREWMVPMKEELGIYSQLDDTHCIEYTQEEFFSELKAAGLTVESYEVRWGEIWARAAVAV